MLWRYVNAALYLCAALVVSKPAEKSESLQNIPSGVVIDKDVNVSNKKFSRLRRLAASLLLVGACGAAPTPQESTTKTAPVKTPSNAGSDAAGKPREAKDEHPVFSLVDNRLLAHVHRGGALVAIPGLPGFAKYMRPGRVRNWKVNQTLDEKKVGLPDTYASFELPQTAEQAKSTQTLYVRVKSTGAKLIDVKLFDKKIGTINLTPNTWKTEQLVIPANTLKNENSFQFVFNGKAAVE